MTEKSKNKIEGKLNIAMVCDPIGSNKSGVVVSTVRFGKLLKERGHNVIFIGARGTEHKNKSHHDGIRIHGFRGFPVPKGGGWYFALPTVKELKKVFQEEKIDVVHVVLPMGAGVAAVMAAKSLNIKVIAASHSQPENLFMDMPKIIQPTLGKFWNKYLAWLYRKADLVIYPAEFGRNLLHYLVGKEKPSTIISNGINIERYKIKEVGDFHDRFNIPKDTINIVYVGRLYPEKSIDTLIKAVPHIVKKYPNVHVMLAGAGHVRPKLEKLVQNLNINKHVTFLGLVSDEDKILTYNAGDIFISPSFAELEGMTVLEAMACGKPIIVPDAEMNAAKFFVSDNGFLFKTEDHVDLAEKALKLISDTNLRKKMGEVSLEKSKNYAIQKSVLLLEAAYYFVLENKIKS